MKPTKKDNLAVKNMVHSKACESIWDKSDFQNCLLMATSIGMGISTDTYTDNVHRKPGVGITDFFLP